MHGMPATWQKRVYVLRTCGTCAQISREPQDNKIWLLCGFQFDEFSMDNEMVPELVGLAACVHTHRCYGYGG